MTRPDLLVCFDCGALAPDGLALRCPCGGTLELRLDLRRALSASGPRAARALFDRRLESRELLDRSGVWRFRELLPAVEPRAIVSKPEGGTRLYGVPRLAAWAGLDALWLKHEGENPTGSFKDRGMTVALSAAVSAGARRVACASTGNTAASMAAYAAQAGLAALVLLPAGKVAPGKLAQALAHGATVLEIEGDFDAAMRLVEAATGGTHGGRLDDTRLLNSLNPFRVEGQKTILFELLQDLGWEAPDWVALPGGNLGNCAALGKAIAEAVDLGLLPRVPRLAVVQAAGANPFYAAARDGGDLVPVPRPETFATAIRIGAPVSWRKALRAVRATGGVVEQVTDTEILAAKAAVDRAGVGAEPASCAAVAGIRKLVERGVIRPGERVAGILTGHLLKDADAALAAAPRAAARRAAADLDSLRRALEA
jgi:threonine synthase